MPASKGTPEERDPFPESIVPMLARLDKLPAPEKGWATEVKWDGVRAIASCRPGRLTLQSRSLHDVTRQYPEVRRLSRQLGARDAVLDGELVAFDEEGRPSFSRLQQRIHQTSEATVRTHMKAYPVTYVIFDLLYLDGEQGLEGLVLKRLGSIYSPGKRTGEWLKVKNVGRQEFVIGGWQPGQGRRKGALGSLLVGYYEDGELRYGGKVGTGFSEQSLAMLAERLAPLARQTSPFVRGTVPKPSEARFVEPELVAEVEYRELTGDGLVRHGSFKGLREDKPATEVVLE